MKKSELFFAVSLVPLDLLMLLAAFLLGYYLKNQGIIFTPEFTGTLSKIIHYSSGGDLMPVSRYLIYLSYIIPSILIIFGLNGMYRIRSFDPVTKRLSQTIVSVSMGMGFLMLLFLLRNDFFIPRSTFIYAWIFSIIFVVIGRLGLHLIQFWLAKTGFGVVNLTVITDQSNFDQYLLMNSKTSTLFKVTQILSTFDLGVIKQKVKPANTDELVIIQEASSAEQLLAVRNYCYANHIGFSFAPNFFSTLVSNYSINYNLGVPTIEVKPTPLEGWGRVQKRLFDLIVTTILILLASPLLLLIAILIKLTSPGPLIYKHERFGKDRQPIKVSKFRTLAVQFCTGKGYQGDQAFQAILEQDPTLAQEWKENHKLKNDPRVSKIGKILRKTSLDELPQFLDVLKGSISLVGPRPITAEEIDKYGETALILYHVKPGLTGLWQVSGRNDLSFANRVRLDANYIENWSVWLDTWILVKTVWMILFIRKGGAY